MKRLFILCLIIVSLSSCSTSLYYQVYNVESDNVMKKERDFIYSDEYCDIKYDLWAENGNLSFMFTNKTDVDICLDMERSCFIKEELAYSYFSNEKKTTKIWIPANSSRFISGFNLSNLFYYDCDNRDLLYPNRISKTIKYNVNNTPLNVTNRLVYHFANDEKDRIIENKFWIADYTNYKANEMFEWKNSYDCLSRQTKNIRVLKHQKTYRFYNIYNKVIKQREYIFE